MADMIQNISSIKSRLPGNVRLVIVSKNQPVDRILQAYETGHRIFGENRVQELMDKHPLLPSDIEWHFIGHLQTNKVKNIVPFISLIHSVDSLKVLKEINKEAIKTRRVINCLLQFHVATEETKYGLSVDEAKEILDSPEYPGLENIRIIGIMGMASFSEDQNLVRSEFIHLKSIFNLFKENYFIDDDQFKEISMGMSGDWQIAVEEGSTLIRVGTAIFS